MTEYSKDFGLNPDHVWLNAASEGPIPKCSAAALQEAIGWKLSVHELTIPRFQQVPVGLKISLSKLIDAPADEIILGNSATYGLHLLANGLSWEAGDDILLMRNDFPTDILPWLHLTKKGVNVRQLKGLGEVLTIEEINAAITPKTKLICLPLIHTFSGLALDVKAIGALCLQKKIIFVVNLSQALGAFPVSVKELSVDAIVCAGYKWLMGPYGTGFCWMKTDLRKRLDYPQAYWIALMDEQSLSSEQDIQLKEDSSAKRYDVFGTANFFNYVPWKASIDYLLNIGLDEVSRHNQELVDILISGIDLDRFEILSPVEKINRTNLVVISSRNRNENALIAAHLNKQGVHIALWKHKLRIAPHIFNTRKDIERFLSVLNGYENDNK